MIFLLLSPVLKWLDETTINRGVCVSMCLLQQLSIKRMAVTSDMWLGNRKLERYDKLLLLQLLKFVKSLLDTFEETVSMTLSFFSFCTTTSLLTMSFFIFAHYTKL